MQLTFEYPDLVSEHHDLDVSARLGSSKRRNEVEDASKPTKRSEKATVDDGRTAIPNASSGS
jgi:hypothetical protein